MSIYRARLRNTSDALMSLRRTDTMAIKNGIR